eukprot:CAMPEP_0167797006 /NCGR_PEP_ID=MMETSP0111_2-20121227/15393_1 /TAXON_ID=91324 /ORGANISM="Lotharella globosa, Strain CCCM811" /LENGTH=129 /DNA_ID=CAMNT_0007691021 /DNA_START=230 /DNA_END=619 /DNA_ORIENTATION=+
MSRLAPQRNQASNPDRDSGVDQLDEHEHQLTSDIVEADFLPLLEQTEASTHLQDEPVNSVGRVGSYPAIRCQELGVVLHVRAQNGVRDDKVPQLPNNVSDEAPEHVACFEIILRVVLRCGVEWIPGHTV